MSTHNGCLKKESNMDEVIPNPQWGFYGTMVEYDTAIACLALGIALDVIRETTGLPTSTCQKFLESRHGRHFADAVVNSLYNGCPIEQAIQLTVDNWMTYIISRRTARECGIPFGLPYLTGFALSLENEY
jgi:hypothetical protein